MTRVALLAASPELRKLLHSMVEEAGLGRIVAEFEGHFEGGEAVSKSFLEAAPEIVLIEERGLARTTQCLAALHLALPEAWLLVISGITDSLAIIETIRAGAREFLPKPVTRESLAGAFARYQAEKERKQPKSSGQFISVTSAKGGSGATTVALNLAVSIASLSQEKRVALVDLDSPFGDTAPYLNLRPEYTVADAVAAGERLDLTLLETYLCNSHGISVLAGPKDLETNSVDSCSLKPTLGLLERHYSYTLLDFPGNLDEDAIRDYGQRSHSILVVCTPELPALWRTHRLLLLLESCGLAEKVRLILNRTSRNDEITEKEIYRTFNRSVFWKLPNDYRRAIEAINTGKPLVSVNHSGLALNYRKLAENLTGITPEKSRGFLGFFS